MGHLQKKYTEKVTSFAFFENETRRKVPLKFKGQYKKS